MGRARPRPPGTARLAALLAVFVLVVPVLLARPAGAVSRADEAAGPYRFRLVEWETAHLVARAGRIAGGLVATDPQPSPADVEAVQRYFAAPPDERRPLRPAAEAAIERALAAIARAEGLAVPFGPAPGGEVVFPPVSFSFQSPPQVLIVSPRDRIHVEQQVLLRPDLSAGEAEALEEGVDDAQRVSLVVPVGGLATYPAMVLEGAGPRETFNAIAHEWVHAYFFFQPLGRRYWDDYDARALNETAAEQAGRELGARLAAAFGYPVEPAGRAPRRGDPPPPPRPPDPFTLAMRATRAEVDRLLAAGQVAEAERYMEERRQALAEQGYYLRKLNQAYFAFYGSYAEGGAAGFDPLPARLEALRQSSPSFGAWLQRVAQLTSTAQVAAAVPGVDGG